MLVKSTPLETPVSHLRRLPPKKRMVGTNPQSNVEMVDLGQNCSKRRTWQSQERTHCREKRKHQVAKLVASHLSLPLADSAKHLFPLIGLSLYPTLEKRNSWMSCHAKTFRTIRCSKPMATIKANGQHQVERGEGQRRGQRVPSETFGGSSSLGSKTTRAFLAPNATRPSLEADKIWGEYQLGEGGNVVMVVDWCVRLETEDDRKKRKWISKNRLEKK